MSNERPAARVRQTPAGIVIQVEAKPTVNNANMVTHTIPTNGTPAEIAAALTAAAAAITAAAA